MIIKRLSLTLYLLAIIIQVQAKTIPNDTTRSNEVKAGYYLVVGAYAKNKESYANSYQKYLQNLGHDARSEYFPRKNYFFVYLQYFTDFNESIRALYQKRKNEEFNECWVYVMRQSEVIDKARDKQLTGLSDLFADRFKNVAEDEADSTNEEMNGVVDIEEVKKEKVVLTQAEPAKSTEQEQPITLPVFMNIFNAQNNDEIEGDVEIVDGVNHAKITGIPGNRLVQLEDPQNGNGYLLLICEVFGFRKQQLDFYYYEPLDNEETEYVTNIGDTIVVNFELQRLRKGDIAPMYNVFFYKDATVMKEESKYEIKKLLDMMNARPTMRITIHGHTNGNATGPIKYYNKESKEYFSLKGIEKEGTGTAKKLSLLRAETILQYLIDNGVNSNRLETKGWGGKQTLYDKHNTQAKQNVRVKIEVLED